MQKEKYHAACLLQYIRHSELFFIALTDKTIRANDVGDCLESITGRPKIPSPAPIVIPVATTKPLVAKLVVVTDTIVEVAALYRYALFRDMWVDSDYNNRMENLLHNLFNAKLSFSMVQHHCFFYSSRETLAMITSFSDSLANNGLTSSDAREHYKSDNLDEEAAIEKENLKRKMKTTWNSLQRNIFGSSQLNWHDSIKMEVSVTHIPTPASPELWSYLNIEKVGFEGFIQECASRSWLSSEKNVEDCETQGETHSSESAPCKTQDQAQSLAQSHDAGSKAGSKAGSPKEESSAAGKVTEAKIFSKSRAYKDYISDLLRLIRNLNAHYNELQLSLQAAIGKKPKDLLRFFTYRFPALATAVFIEALKEDHWEGVPNKCGRLPALEHTRLTIYSAELVDYHNLFADPFDPYTEEE